MKRCRVPVLTVIVLGLSLAGCDPFSFLDIGGDGNTDDAGTGEDVAETAIFDIPSSMTGVSEGTGSIRELSAGTVATVNGFFSHVRFQIWFASTWSRIVRGLIYALEHNGVFDATSGFTTVLGSPYEGDKIRWSVLGDDAYLLEWWRSGSGGTFQKYVELTLDEFSRNEGTVLVRGDIVVDITANTDIALVDGFSRNAEWVRVEFDSQKLDRGGARWMRVIATGFQHESLDPSRLTVPAPTDYQECVIDVTLDADGMVTLSGSTSVPGTTQLSYSSDEYEMRYYVYTAKGNADRATINLAMPLDTYNAAEVFTTFENTAIGGVISEYFGDLLREDGTFGASAGHQILGALMFAQPYSNAEPPTPTTAEIRAAINTVYDQHPAAVGEDLYTLMNIENPVYCVQSGYVGFGSEAPAGHPAASELPQASEIITQSTINGVDATPIVFGNPGDDPGF